MKVEGPSNLHGASPARRTGRSEGGSGGAFARLVGETGGTASLSAANPLAGVSGVLALQEVDDATARASRGKKRAQEMLDKLDEIRHGLLAGELPRDKLRELSHVVQSRRMHVDDPRLGEVLDQIDLRAQVELAKLGG
jgi:hypothetical protein